MFAEKSRRTELSEIDTPVKTRIELGQTFCTMHVKGHFFLKATYISIINNISIFINMKYGQLNTYMTNTFEIL